MKHNLHAHKTGGSSAALAIIVGTLTTCLISFLLTIALTGLVMNGYIEKNETDVFVFFIRAISVMIGSLLASALSKEKILLTIGLTTGIYLMILLLLGFIFYNNAFRNFGAGVISALVGGACASIIKLKLPIKKKHFVKLKR